MISKNLTPFFWGPKLTSRRPPQPEMAICVRGTFRLAPGLDVVTAIEDPIDQGFMTGDTYAPDDMDMTGEVLHPNDFADWKPFGEVILKGTAYVPDGPAVATEVKLGVGEWSKALRVLGARTFKPGMLGGGSVSDPEPFTHLPLSWSEAFGGERFPKNPIGKGVKTAEMPRIEVPGKPVRGQSTRGMEPAGFGPLNPLWPQRRQYLGKKWGASWENNRKPFYAEDFDWRYFQAAPADQIFKEYLRGDELLTFQNLHPREPQWSTRLPGLRIRAFVRGGDDQIREASMVLDTLYIDLDAARLYLTWRGHVPCQQLDMTDVKSVLIDSEPLNSQAKPLSHYKPQLEAFEDDPIGLKEAFPPGFLEVADAIKAAEAAERDGTEKPDLKKVADSLPAGCPFPPWFLAAVGGDPDPLGIMDKIPKSLLGDDPVGLKAKFGKLADPKAVQEVLKPLQELQGKPPTAIPQVMEELAEQLPADARDGLKQGAQEMRGKLAEAKRTEQGAKALAKPVKVSAEKPPTAAEQIKSGKAKGVAALEVDAQKLGPNPAGGQARLAASQAKVAALPEFDALVAASLACLDKVEIPGMPKLPDTDGQLAAMTEKMQLKRARMESRGLQGNPLMKLFDMGQRIIDKAPRPQQIPMPDMTPLLGAMGKTRDVLMAQGASLAAVAPLTGLMGRLENLIAQIPQEEGKPAEVDYAYQELPGASFAGQDLKGKSFARATLTGADFRGADLSGADLRGAKLSKANFVQANLAGAVFDKADLQQADLAGANLPQARLRGVNLAQSRLTQAVLTRADLQGADLQKATLPGAVLEQADLTDAWLQDADLQGARLGGAKLEQVKGQSVNLSGADLRQVDASFADFGKANLSGCSLSGANLSVAQLPNIRADNANLSGVQFDMTNLQGARLVGATLRGSKSEMGLLIEANLADCDLQDCQLFKVDFSKAAMVRTNFVGAKLNECILFQVRASAARFDKTDLRKSHAVGSAFDGCSFVASDAFRTVWFQAQLSNCDFSHAKLAEATFLDLKGERLNFFAAVLKQANFRKADVRLTRFVSSDLCGVDFAESTHLDNQFVKANLYDAKFLSAQLASCDWAEASMNRARFDQAEGAPQR